MASMVIIRALQDVQALNTNRDKGDEFSTEPLHRFVPVCYPHKVATDTNGKKEVKKNWR